MNPNHHRDFSSIKEPSCVCSKLAEFYGPSRKFPWRVSKPSPAVGLVRSESGLLHFISG